MKKTPYFGKCFQTFRIDLALHQWKTVFVEISPTLLYAMDQVPRSSRTLFREYFILREIVRLVSHNQKSCKRSLKFVQTYNASLV